MLIEQASRQARELPVLLYRGSCPKCRALSALAVLCSAGALRRIPIDSREAGELYALHPESAGQLALFEHDRAAFDWRVVPRAARVALRARRERGRGGRARSEEQRRTQARAADRRTGARA